MEHWNNSHQVEPRKLWQGMVSCQTNQQFILSHTNWQNLFNIYNRWRPAVSAADDYLCWWLGLRWLKVWRLLFRSWSILYIAFQYHHCCLVLILIGSPLIFLTQYSDLVGGTRPCKSWTWYSARSCLPCAQVNYSYACSFFSKHLYNTLWQFFSFPQHSSLTSLTTSTFSEHLRTLSPGWTVPRCGNMWWSTRISGTTMMWIASWGEDLGFSTSQRLLKHTSIHSTKFHFFQSGMY